MNAVNAAIVAALKADQGLIDLGVTGVYKSKAPQGTTQNPVVPPYIVYFRQAGSWETDHGGGVIRKPQYLVKVVDLGTSSVRAGLIDEQIAAVLSGVKLTLVGGRRYLGLRTGDMPDVDEVVDGKTYQSVGGMYRFIPA